MTQKDAGMRIRIERDLRDGFVAACNSQGLVAAEVLRDFMRGFAGKHSSEQRALFAAPPVAPRAPKRVAKPAKPAGPAAPHSADRAVKAASTTAPKKPASRSAR